MQKLTCVALFLTCLLAGSALAAPADGAAKVRALDILGKSVGFRTVEGAGQVPAYAAYLKSVLVDAGYDAEDIVITPVGETATLVARWKGTGSKKPMLLIGHMDVVAADPKDWTRDPFTMVSENGYHYGRGVLDNKFDISMIVATLANLRRTGFKPSRDIILALSGDEETAMVTTQGLAKQFAAADFVLNGDAGGASLNERGAPMGYAIQAAEKTYADFEITVTNPGGHSSRPTKSNAIYDLARIIDRLAAHEFPLQSSELTRGMFKVTATKVGNDLGAAMKAFAEDPANTAAAARIAQDPEYVGQLRTTCVTTMLSGGHALNALPQRATASVNCRIFPGVKVEDVKATLVQVIANDRATIKTLGEPVASDASPLRPDIMAALRKAVNANHKQLPIVPQMSAGATDSLYYRNLGVPSYGVSGVYMKPSDDFAHGLNERIPDSTVQPALRHYNILITELAR